MGGHQARQIGTLEVGGEELATVKETNVINSLSGRVAGVVLTQSPSGPGGGTRVVIRGNNSITGDNQPLYVVDGVPMDNSGFGSAAGTGTANYRRDDYGTGISEPAHKRPEGKRSHS